MNKVKNSKPEWFDKLVHETGCWCCICRTKNKNLNCNCPTCRNLMEYFLNQARKQGLIML